MDDSDDKNLTNKYQTSFFDNFINYCKNFKENKIILVGSDTTNTGKTTIIEKLMYFLNQQNKKVLYIHTINQIQEETKDALINDNLFLNKNMDYTKFNTINENVHKAYLLINDSNQYDLADLKSMENFFTSLYKSEYDYIFIETSDTLINPYFFTSLAGFCSFVCLVCKYKHSHRKNLQELVSVMQKKDISNIKGVLNVIHKKYI